MQMEDREGERILSLCGTILNRQKLLFCDKCGATLGPARYLDFIRKKTGAVGPISSARRICDACARKESAKVKVDIMPV